MGPATILVVEDDAGIRELLAECLEAEGYQVVMACNGDEALGKVGQARPTLVLLDLMMPVMDGITFVYELQRRGLFASLAIIALSASPTLRQRIEALGVEHILIKPFDLPVLLETIREVTGGEREKRGGA